MKKITLLILMSLFSLLGHSHFSESFDYSEVTPLGWLSTNNSLRDNWMGDNVSLVRTCPDVTNPNLNPTRPICPPPTALTVVSTTGTTATLQWTAGSTETQWEIVVQDPGSGVPTAASIIIAAGTNPFTVTGLDPVSSYEYYVRAVCSASDISTWSGPIAFSTICDIFQVPFMEGFNSSSFSQQCWTVVNGNTDADSWNMDYTITPFEGNQSAMMFTDLNAGNNNDWLISPTLNFSATPRTKRLKFHYKVQSGTEPNDFRVVLSTTGAAQANFTQTLIPLASYTNTTYVERIVNLVDASNNPYTGNVNIAWHVPSGGADGNRLFIDNVIIEDIPTCPNPTNLVASGMSYTSATLSWTPGYNETQWEVIALPTGSPAPFAGQTGTLVTSPPPFVLNNLPASTTYDFYVRAICSATDVSVWSTPVTAATLVGYNQCAMPLDIPVNNTNQCLQVRNMSLLGSTASTEGGTTCGTANSGDIWFQFRAINAAQTIDLMNFTGTPQPIALTLYSGQCGSLNQIACSLNNSITVTGLQVNTIYLVRASVNAVTTNLNVQFNVCIKTPQPPANGSALNCLINTVNYDFELPDVTGTSPSFPIDHQMLGWRTTATDHVIEVWPAPNYENHAAYSGSQFIELNAYQVSGVYQDYATPVTTVFNYGFAHKGRQGVDTVALLAGPPGGPYVEIRRISTGVSAWSYNTGSYTVPAGQAVTRFIFQSISSVGGATIGNFLDAINFTADNSIISATPMTLNCTTNTTTVTAAGMGTWSAHSNNPTTTVIANTTANTTTISGFSVPGVYQFDWTTLYCTTTIAITYVNNGNTVPLFNQVQPVCASAAIPALPATSTNGVTGVWSPAINNIATTTYTFTPNAGQCATTTTMTITVNPGATPTFTQIAPICSGGSLAAFPTTSNEGITGTWSPALNNTNTTTYTFTPTTGQCASPTTMTVTVTPNVTPTFTQVAPICAGETLAALPSTSNEGLSGTWAPALNNTATTTYTFTPNAGPCAVPTTMTITVTPNVIPTFTQVAPVCNSGTMLPLPTTSTNGIAGVWSPALNNTATTTYTFTPNALQCAIPTTMTIVVNPIVTPTFTQVPPICSGSTLAALPTTSNEGITGVWSPALDNTTTTLYTFTPDAGQCAIPTTMTITVNPLPTIGGTLSVCAGLTTQLTGSGTPAAANAWSSSDTAIATVNGAGLVTGASAGTVTITYTNSTGCLTTALVTVNALPTISGVLTICIGETTQLTGSQSPAASNAWTSSTTSVATIDATGLVTGVSAGTTTFTYINNNGCSINTVVEVLSTPTANIAISGASTICGGTTTDITITGSPNTMVNYTVNGAPASVALPASGTVTFTTANLSVQTTYQLVDVTSISGCTGILSQSVVVNIAAQPTASISGSTGVCINTSTSITFSGTPGATVEYTVNAGAIQTVLLDATGTAIVNTGILTSDVTYTLVNVTAGTTPNCIQTLTDSATVTVNQLPTVTVNSPSTCVGTNTSVMATPGTAGTYSYAWTVPTGFTNPGDVASFPTSTAGSYSVVITNATTGCVSARAFGTVTVNPLPTVTVNTTTVCAGASATLTATPGTAATYSYAWTVPTGATNPGNVPSFSTTIPGTYSVIITDLTTNCSSASASGAVNNNPLPTVTVNNPSICSGAIATVTATPGSAGTYSYAWTVPNGVTNPGDVPSFTTFTPGAYSVTITNLVTNCSSVVATGNVSLNPTPTVTAISASPILCSGQSTGIQLQSNVPNTTFTWTYTQTGGVIGASNGNGNIISQVLTVSGTTQGTVTYTITPTAPGSCTGIPISVTVTVTPVPVVNLNTTSLSFCTGGTTNITMTSNVATATFNWNVVQSGGVTGGTSGTGTSINDILTSSGTTIGQAIYTITPYNNGCPGTPKTVTVTVYPNPTVMASPSSATICSGDTTNISLTSNVPGTVFNWTVVQTGLFGAASGSGSTISQTLTTVGLVQGSVTYTITPTVNGCTGNPITVTVTVNPTPEVFSSAVPQVICSGESAGITVTPNIPGTSIEWTVVQSGVTGGFDGSGSETTPGTGIAIDQILTTTGNAPGTATYTITPVNNGCYGNPITVVIQVNPLPSIKILDGVICVDSVTGALIYGYTMDTGLSETDYIFQWYFNNDMTNVIGTDSSYVAEAAGVYTVSIMNAVTGCFEEFTINVTASNPAQSATAIVTNYFEDTQAITVTVVGNGSYLYSLDGGEFQSSNVFPHVLPGLHTVTIHDTIGCTDITLRDILTIGYPHFFTPNGDGIHDTWNIWSLQESQPNSEIHIYDRYGKLIKQIIPNGTGWDGTFNGHLLPSTDYWFTVKFIENGAEKMFKAHFSMKR